MVRNMNLYPFFFFSGTEVAISSYGIMILHILKCTMIKYVTYTLHYTQARTLEVHYKFDHAYLQDTGGEVESCWGQTFFKFLK